VCSGAPITLYTYNEYAEEVILRKKGRKKERKKKIVVGLFCSI